MIYVHSEIGPQSTKIIKEIIPHLREVIFNNLTLLKYKDKPETQLYDLFNEILQELWMKSKKLLKLKISMMNMRNDCFIANLNKVI